MRGNDAQDTLRLLYLHVRLVVTWRNVDAFRELFFLAPWSVPRVRPITCEGILGDEGDCSGILCQVMNARILEIATLNCFTLAYVGKIIFTVCVIFPAQLSFEWLQSCDFEFQFSENLNFLLNYIVIFSQNFELYNNIYLNIK